MLPTVRKLRRFIAALVIPEHASRGGARRHAVLERVLHGAHERVDLLERRVDVRGDPHALVIELLAGIRTLHHRLADDSILVPQKFVEPARFDPIAPNYMRLTAHEFGGFNGRA
jgi:hypothetical protein